ncbi:hypothetical protein [Ruegeria marina]|uniref:hypothetical protein n=1 Tax=Ruegeria marina TaxID=639004 RepID=UPI0015A0B481
MSPFIAGFPFDLLLSEPSQVSGYLKVAVIAHGGNEKFHAAAAIWGFAQGMVNLARCDDGAWIRGAHPVNRGVDIALGYDFAATDDHGGPPDDPFNY